MKKPLEMKIVKIPVQNVKKNEDCHLCRGSQFDMTVFNFFYSLIRGQGFYKKCNSEFYKKIKSKILRQHRMQFCESSKEHHDISEHATIS